MIDLHMHSCMSDGTDPIPELLRKVREAGITVFSVTDHDTMEGALEMERLVKEQCPTDVTFIRGIEFSSITEEGKCHILGYGCDRNEKALTDILEEGAAKRRNKLEKRLSFLKEEFGIEFEADEMSHLRSMNSVGKPHLGNMLVEKGYAEIRDEAIEKYIEPCKTETDRLDGEKVIRTILRAGGVPVWAHPLGGTAESELSIPEFEKQLKTLKDFGLMGLECYYSRYTIEQADMLASVAVKNGLRVSGGSDYHGKNKPVHLAELNASGVPVTEDRLSVLEIISGDR